MLAKAQITERKRKREADMDVDMEDANDGGEDEWMDVDDDEERTPNKRVKGNSGTVVAVNSKGPRTNRQLAGMRDHAVSVLDLSKALHLTVSFYLSKHRRPSKCVTLDKDLATCLPKQVRAIGPSERKWFVFPLTYLLS
jgi:nucleolar GTP-binding protein